MKEQLFSLGVILILNTLNALYDGSLIKKKKSPNHILNGAVYVSAVALIWVVTGTLNIWEIVAMFCCRQIVFDGLLNLFRNENWFYTSLYTSFYQKENQIQSGSIIDKIENFFIDGIINTLYGRPWSYTWPINMNIRTYNNYLNGKVQAVIYTAILIISILQL